MNREAADDLSAPLSTPPRKKGERKIDGVFFPGWLGGASPIMLRLCNVLGSVEKLDLRNERAFMQSLGHSEKGVSMSYVETILDQDRPQSIRELGVRAKGPATPPPQPIGGTS